MANSQGQVGPTTHEEEKEHASLFLERNKGLIQKTARLLAIGAPALSPEAKAELREEWRQALRSNVEWRIIRNQFGLVVVNFDGFDGRLFEAIYEGPYARLTGNNAEALRNVSQMVGYRVDRFTPYTAAMVVDAYYAKFSGTTIPGDLLAAMTAIQKTSNKDVQTLEHWIESSERRKADREQKERETQAAINEGLAGLGKKKPEPDPDPRVEVVAKLAAAKASKASALEAEDGDALKAAKVEIAKLEAELAALDAAAAAKPAPAPAPVQKSATPSATPKAETTVATAAPVAAIKPNGAAIAIATPVQPSVANVATEGEGDDDVDSFFLDVEEFKKLIMASLVSEHWKEVFVEAANKVFGLGNPSELGPMKTRFEKIKTLVDPLVNPSS